jgi:hypothetical protein
MAPHDTRASQLFSSSAFQLVNLSAFCRSVLVLDKALHDGFPAKASLGGR